MTVPSENYLIEYAGNDVSDSFVIPFGFSDNADIRVSIRDANGDVTDLSTGFTISGAGAGTGTCDMDDPPATGETLVIAQAPELLQETDYVSNDKFPAETHEAALDRQTRISHRLYEQGQRALRVPFGDSEAGDGTELPSATARASKYLAFDSQGRIALAVAIAITTLTQSSIGELLQPQNQHEIDAGVTPTQHWYNYGIPERYGALGDGTTDDTTAVNAAVDVIKAGYDSTNDVGPAWNLLEGSQYRLTSRLHLGASAVGGGRVKAFHGNGALFICDHTDVGIDLTNLDRANYYSLHIKSGTSTPKILLLQMRYSDSSAIIGINHFYDLRIGGEASIAGHYMFGTESNVYHGYQVQLEDNSIAATIITDTGRHWDGAAFVDDTALFTNQDSGDPVQGGVSNSNNHFHGAIFNNKSTAAHGGQACLQVIGIARHTFHGFFANINDTALRIVQSHRDTVGGGNGIVGVRVFGFNPHNNNDIAWENVQGNLTDIELWGDHNTGATTADFQMTAGTLTRARMRLGKIVLAGQATGQNDFYVRTSITLGAATEGNIYLEDGATISFAGGTSATKRYRVFDSDSARTYLGRDSTDYTTTSTVGTGADNLKSYTIVGDTAFMGAAGRKLEVRATFTKTGSAGNKTINYALGSVTPLAIFPAANDTNPVHMVSIIEMLASNSARVETKVWANGAVTIDRSTIETIDMTANQTIQFTGECANGADLISQTSLSVRQLA